MINLLGFVVIQDMIKKQQYASKEDEEEKDD